jgi:DNA ligase-1
MEEKKRRMNDFVTLFLELDQTNKTNDKVAALEKYLQHASPADRMWMIALFTGRGPKRAINSRYLQEWAIAQAKLPIWLFEEMRDIVGDLAETLAFMLPQTQMPPVTTLSEWMRAILALPTLSLEQKKQHITHMWQQLSAKERVVFNKILIGGFRLGVSQNLIVRALANATGQDAAVIAHRLMGNWDPATTVPDFLWGHGPDVAQYTRPYPFCLAYPLDVPLEKLGPCADWSLEWKWDGIRAQIVHRQDFFTIWSRGEEVANDRFPELMQLQALLPKGVVLDGEILAANDEQILSFQFLQQRLGRKNITAAILKEIPVIFLAYDLLEWEGNDLRAQPFAQRRLLLEQLITPFIHQKLLRLSPQISIKNWKEASAIRQQSRANLAEGLMLKKMDSAYHVGRKRGDWWKWKIESYTVDAVLIYAQMGSGWRANTYSDYTFAIWDKDQLIPFAKAYSGLTKQELSKVDQFVKKNTVEKFGPVRSVKPELVFEIAFEGIQLSKRHKSGLAVRFPRILRWRHDKRPEDADSLQTLKALLDTPS